MGIHVMDFDIQEIFNNFLHLIVAYGLAFPLGWDREKSKRSFGLRTFPLIAVVTCGYTLAGISFLDGTDAEARVIQGIITGIGFIGGGAIFRNRGRVSGTASAVSIWNTGAIGVSVACDRIEIAVLLSVLNFLTLRFIKQLKESLENNHKTGDAVD